MFTVKSRLNMLLASIKFLKDETIQQTLSSIFPSLEVKENKLLFGGIEITEDQFDLLFDMLMVSAGQKSFEDFEKPEGSGDEEFDEFFKRQKEYEEKIKKAKMRSQKFEFDQVVLAVVTYFPQYKIQDLLKINYFTLLTLYEYAIKREYQFINDVAAGNGLMSKDTKYQPLF